jgi:hypothetical protein
MTTNAASVISDHGYNWALRPASRSYLELLFLMMNVV